MWTVLMVELSRFFLHFFCTFISYFEGERGWGPTHYLTLCFQYNVKYSRQHCGHMYAHRKATSAAKGSRTRVAGIQSHRALANYIIATLKIDGSGAVCFSSDFALLPMLISHVSYTVFVNIFLMSYYIYETFYIL